MIYVDSNIAMYLVGAEHPNKTRVVDKMRELFSAHESLVTSAEAFQEILHRYRAIQDPAHLSAAYEALETLVQVTEPVTKLDVDQAKAILQDHPQLSSRDCLHVATMKRLGCDVIWTYDEGFKQVIWVTVIA